MAATDDAFSGGFLGSSSKDWARRCGVNLLSGIGATTFLTAGMQISGDSAAVIGVVLTIPISTVLLS